MMEQNANQNVTDYHRSGTQEVTTQFPQEMNTIPKKNEDERPRKDGPGGE